MPSRSAWSDLTDAVSEKIGDYADKTKSIYGRAKAVQARASADKLAADRASSAARTTPMPASGASAPPATVDPATRNLSATNAASTVSGAPSQIDKAIESMDH
jgi:hypothetical protein